MSVTIADVAKLVGVSTATVSRVLNGKATVDPETRARVQEAMRELNYTPNLSARQLGTGQSMMLGLVLPDITNPFFPLVARGAGDAAHQSGYTLVLANSDGDPRLEEEALRALIGRRVDGIIVAPAANRAAWVKDIVGDQVPVVLLDRHVDGPAMDCVAADNRAGSALAAQHLLELGHRCIGYISGPEGLASADERRESFIARATAGGAEMRPEWIVGGDFQLLSGFQAMQQLLLQPERPTAVACGNDLMALGALRALRQAGLTPPHDMAIVGYDDVPVAALSEPALTTVAQPAYRMGAAAVELLLQRIHAPGEEAEPVSLALPVRLVVRESCGGGKRGEPLWL